MSAHDEKSVADVLGLQGIDDDVFAGARAAARRMEKATEGLTFSVDRPVPQNGYAAFLVRLAVGGGS